ncbi:MAG: tail fiber domain-containing protein [Bryobacteraceae bacterium]
MKQWRYSVIAGLWVAGLNIHGLYAQSALNFVPVPPCRLVDTRNPIGAFGGPSLQPGTSRNFSVLSGSCGIPANASAYSFNVTVVPAGFLGYLTVWPAGGAQPLASTINSYLGVAVANAAIVSAGTNGAVSVYATNLTDVILDINGYFIAQSNSSTQSVALGVGSLPASSLGIANTAIGINTLQINSTGAYNVGVGASALLRNTTGSNNTAVGSAALGQNTGGGYNSAFGYNALAANALGLGNTAVGYTALFSNNANYNTAVGIAALSNNTMGGNNTALGYFALSGITNGGANIAIGTAAGQNVAGSGSYNIEIGNQGTPTDSNVIRIGTPGEQMSTFIAGINTSSVAGSPVIVNSSGQLGILLSSERYKEDVQDMGNVSDSLMRLRPVTFHYKRAEEDGRKPLNYGLIAEEVAKVYPELVVYGEHGKIESVQYHQLPALLLNELQKQHQTIQELQERIAGLETLLRDRYQATIASGK